MTIDGLTVHIGDCRESMRRMPEQSVQTCVTSPPYFGLRDYGHDGQIGLEPTPDEFVTALVEVFREVRRVLRDDGTLWLNLGDSYINNPASAVNRNGMSGSLNNGKTEFECRTGTRGSQQRTTIPAGLKVKDLAGIPWRVAFALQADGWYLRQDIIWAKPNPMPESVRDRCTKAHEYIFLLTKSARYFYDAEAIKEQSASSDPSHQHYRANGKSDSRKKHVAAVCSDCDGSGDGKDGEYGDPCKLCGGTGLPPKGGGFSESKAKPAFGNSGMKKFDGRNRRSVWTVSTKPYSGAHFATFPPDLIEPCILAGSKPGDVVLDPFGGSGTTAGVALKHGRQAVLCELNPEYAALIPDRVADVHPHLNQQRLFA